MYFYIFRSDIIMMIPEGEIVSEVSFRLIHGLLKSELQVFLMTFFT